MHAIFVTDAQGQTFQLQARICRPAGDAPAAVVVINHGSPAKAQDRPTMQLGRCDQESATWFLSRGYVVVFALRRGYGGSGGGWAESFGGCNPPDFVRGGIETARDIDAIVNYATALPFVRRDGAVVVGQSAGGKADFEQLAAYDGDGNHLFFGRGGSTIWGPLVERYLADQRAAPN